MEAFIKLKGVVVPIDRANIDTDALIPKQFLRKIERSGFGKHLFHEWRYLDYAGTLENPDFNLNKATFKNASIMLSRDNFGCGSSREHAPWALYDYGIRVIIAPSFADIFYNNCLKNGILLVRLSESQVDGLFKQINNLPGAQMEADLDKQIITAPNKEVFPFEINEFSKYCLLNGLDQIDWSLQFEDKISAFESALNQEKPWLS